jgi:signal transduction histidine kinase
MNRKLLEMIKLKEQLLYDVSHELRSPLTRVNVALEMIEQNNLTASMRDDLRSMDKMIRDLLENGRFDGTHLIVKKENFSLKDLCGGIITKLNSQTRIVNDCDKIIINGDKEKSATLLRNIIENAVKYSNTDTPVEISASPVNGGVTVSVRDRGIGIRQEDIERIFEPFYRTDLSRSRETGGFGLGLSIAKKIASAHGGKIWAESRDDGTVFNVFFPE